MFLNWNMESTHEVDFFPCQQCYFTTQYELTSKLHLKEVHENWKITFSCEMCDYTFETDSEIEIHTK